MKQLQQEKLQSIMIKWNIKVIEQLCQVLETQINVLSVHYVPESITVWLNNEYTNTIGQEKLQAPSAFQD